MVNGNSRGVDFAAHEYEKEIGDGEFYCGRFFLFVHSDFRQALDSCHGSSHVNPTCESKVPYGSWDCRGEGRSASSKEMFGCSC